MKRILALVIIITLASTLFGCTDYIRGDLYNELASERDALKDHVEYLEEKVSELEERLEPPEHTYSYPSSRETQSNSKENPTEATIYNPSSVNDFACSGTGDYVATGLEVDNYAILECTHDGSSNFVVKAYDENENSSLLINTTGKYSGKVLVEKSGTIELEIKADGNWSITASGLKAGKETSFSGSGDFVTSVFTPISGIWEVSNSGDSNFVVYIHDTLLKQKKLLVNEIGDYNGTVRASRTSTDGSSFFVIKSNGNWKIDKK